MLLTVLIVESYRTHRWFMIIVISYIVLVTVLTSDKIGFPDSFTSKEDMDGFKFESFVAGLLKMNHFTDVQVTKKSGDYGIDIIAYLNDEKYAIQCKYYSGKVGNDSVQQAYSGKAIYGADKAVVVTNSFFTESAIISAKTTSVILWDRKGLDKLKTAASRNRPFYKRYFILKFLCLSLMAAFLPMSLTWIQSQEKYLFFILCITLLVSTALACASCIIYVKKIAK